ncbi:peptide chain release factor N(5)-glutamine methyltransferase [Rhodococcus antarcticus]|uniref:Release factor glutamine methyltransferase n=1 Tax=Rhodococcus antarcticus TaxID=2987751 RepID=A0ABY6P2M6_9NOCA|nr:peptide chain release factor N(5)-glutamine methyltransferase [Rhodococcus antarcticus]UZJ25596.1 peptide chain release factor N(5)-glutamine methyltransferase [Rhodococcus antarcticus]
MSRQPLRLAVLEATSTLEAAGVGSPRVDAELLAAHVVGVERGRLPMVPLVDPLTIETYRRLVAQRAARVPLQHLTGWAAMGAITVEVGPGVFTPRPETELLMAWALAELEGTHDPVVLDLCTGSGVLALSIAQARPDARVHAVESDPTALAWARRNADARAGRGDTPVRLHQGDVTDRRLLVQLEGQVDLVVANPPYVPLGTPVEPEVADHDPAAAVFGGADGLAVLRPIVYSAATWLKVGGAVGVEHDDSHGVVVPALFSTRTVFTDVQVHTDLADRPRFTTARRVSRSG